MIWVLTAGFGDGHNTAAKSVAEALQQKAPNETILVTDLISEVHPLLSNLLQSAYRLAITTFPSLWKLVYQWFAKPSICNSARCFRPLLSALEQRLSQEPPPRLLISTYPLYSGLLAALAEKGVAVPPLVTVITDSITVHPSWIAAPSDLLCVADEETLAAVKALGVPAEKIRITGFPVRLAFTQPPASAEQTAARILYMPSTATAHVAATLKALQPLLNEHTTLTVQTGRNSSRLYHTLRRFTDEHPNAPVQVLSWTNQMPQLLQSHDVLICKAGGAILHEALAARIPAIIDYVVPGQEEGNAELLLQHQCGLRSQTPAETAAHLRRLLDNRLALAHTLRTHMQPLSVPGAALHVAELALSLAR